MNDDPGTIQTLDYALPGTIRRFSWLRLLGGMIVAFDMAHWQLHEDRDFRGAGFVADLILELASTIFCIAGACGLILNQKRNFGGAHR